MIQPLNNNCLIEVIDEYDGIIRDAANETVQKGVLREFMLTGDHLTASTGYDITGIDDYAKLYGDLVGKTVYWEEYSDIGKKFEEDGKRYVLVPFYRLIGYEE